MSTSTVPVAQRIDRSPTTAKVDNLLRQMLKVSDPNDAQQIAQGLRTRFAAEAGQMDREQLGLPATRRALDVNNVIGGPKEAPEVGVALDELEIDLRQIQSDPATKDTHAELRGIASSIRTAAAAGLAASRVSLDPLQRDRAFSARRSLSEYARIVRYVGALSGGVGAMYRRLAKSCDMVSNLILVGCGEAMAEGGVTRSSFIRKAPVAEMLARRDAAIVTLRNLLGSVEQAHGPNEWPRGPEAYRRLMQELDEGGQSDLRSLFNETDLAHLFDELIDLASSNNSDSLRAVGTVAASSIGRINRLIGFAQHTGISPESPPLAAFLSALSLFTDAFTGTSRGFRLVYVARPPILTYGLFGAQGVDPETGRLLTLILLRNRLAEALDCILECNCDRANIQTQLRVDKILFDVDRSIDYSALGSDGPDLGVTRSIAYGALVAALLANHNGNADGLSVDVTQTLRGIEQALGWPVQLAGVQDPIALGTLLHEELCLQESAELQWEQLVRALSSNCELDAMMADNQTTVIRQLLGEAHDDIVNRTGAPFNGCRALRISIPPHIETSFDTIANDVLNNGDFRDI